MSRIPYIVRAPRSVVRQRRYVRVTIFFFFLAAITCAAVGRMPVLRKWLEEQCDFIFSLEAGLVPNIHTTGWCKPILSVFLERGFSSQWMIQSITHHGGCKCLPHHSGCAGRGFSMLRQVYIVQRCSGASRQIFFWCHKKNTFGPAMQRTIA